jgi:hypothetical protein
VERYPFCCIDIAGEEDDLESELMEISKAIPHAVFQHGNDEQKAGLDANDDVSLSGDEEDEKKHAVKKAQKGATGETDSTSANRLT